jgi:ABC-2 type transport system permease protein
VLYPWSFAREQLGGGWAEQLYIANPLTIAAQLFQLAFWFPGVETDRETVGPDQLIPELFTRGVVALLVSLVLLGVGQLAFSRLESRFAQEL